MKKDRRTQTAMQDRYKWLKGLAKLRSYNFNGRENDYLFILYIDMQNRQLGFAMINPAYQLPILRLLTGTPSIAE